MKIFDVLHKDTKIFGKKIIEASAGTGKTFAIEHLIVRLLLEKEKFLTIDQILVVTFTKAATKELRYRIRNTLQEALNFLKNKFKKGNIFSYLNSYIGQSDKTIKLQNAIDLFETAQIFTIHSFCFKALKEFAFEADILIDVDEKEDLNLNIKKIISNYLKYFLDPDLYLPEQIDILIKKNTNAEGLMQNIFQNIDKTFDKSYKGYSEHLKYFNENLNFFDKVNLNELKLSFENISKNFKKSKFKNIDFSDQLDLLVSIINKKHCSKKDFQKLLKDKFNIFEFLAEKNKKVRAEDFVIPQIFQKAKNKLYPIVQEAIDPNIIFYRLTKDIAKEINLFLEKDEIFSYDKILNKMKEALKNDRFIKKVQINYKAAIIDEFQDTDPVQFEIFENLFLKNKNLEAFYLIGDPKQSIYSFRKADLYTYLKAARKIDEINYLDTNYRSSKTLIRSLNALFGANFSKNWLKLPQKNESLKYVPIKAGLKFDFDFQDSYQALHFFIAQDNFVKKKWPTDEIEQKYFFFITSEILKLKKNHKFEESNFAVLVKDRYQANRLKKYFQKYSIKSITTRGTSLKDSIVLKAMKEFLKATENPTDLNKVKIALMGPFIGFNDDKIKNLDLMKNPQIIEKFYELKIALKKGFGFFFNLFFKITFDKKTILETIASKKDIHFYLDIISLIELILSEKKIISIQSFFQKLETLDPEDEKLKINQQFDAGVQILTTFMSKGLEYDIVFALGLVNRSKINFLNEDVEEIDAEKMRQFYVTLTRAKYRVYLPIAIDLKEKEILNGTYSCMEYFLSHIIGSKNVIKKQDVLDKLDILKSQSHISYSFIEKANTKNFEDVKKEKKEVNLYPPTDFSKKFISSYIYSFSSLQKIEQDFLVEKKQSKNLPTGPVVGNIFHKILEKIFRKKSFVSKNITKIIQDEIINTPLENFGEKIFLIIQNTLKVPLLKDEKFSLMDVDTENFLPEVEFLFSYQNDYLKGFIDLVFHHNNRYYIIDWKSNFLGETSIDYSIKNIENEMQEHSYFMQASIYAEALRRYLKIIKKDFSKNFGGVFYVFLRALAFNNFSGIYHFFPKPIELIEQNITKKVLC